MKNLVFIFLLMMSGVAIGQTPTLQALVSKTTVQVGGRITISYQFNYSGEDFTAPPNITKNFRILGGPNKRSEMSYVNGSMASKVSYSYVVSPINVGTFVINPAQIEFENKVYSSQAIKINVVKAQTQNKQTQNATNNEKKQLKSLNKNIYLKLTVDKKTAYQGEQIVATYRLYNKANLRGIEAQRMPEFDGFYTQDIELNNGNSRKREIINGVPFDIYILKKTILVPQKTGELDLIPLEIDAIVQIQSDKAINTWFGPRYQMKDVQVLIKSNSLKLNIKPLPKGAPESFNGAVGNFKFSTRISPTEIAVNDAINYVIKISGTGNLPLVNNPVPKWPQEFEVYDPKLKSTSSTKSNKITGSKSWDYLAIPRNGGEYELESLDFTFFNPATKKYQTISTDPTTIMVTGSSITGDGGHTKIIKQDVSRMGTDIRFIHTGESNLVIAGDTFYGTVWFYFWLITPLALGGLAYVVLNKQSEMKADTIGLKKKGATKKARTHLKKAAAILGTTDQTQFYEAVSNALNGYLSNKYNLSNLELNRNHIEKVLKGSQVSEATLNALLSTLDHCEMARFAPVSEISKKDLLTQAEEIIVKLEDEVK